MSKMTILQPSPARVRQSSLPRLRAPPVTSATRPAMPRSILLLAFEVRRALLEEGLDALARVRRPEHLLEGPRLDLEGLIDRRLDAVVHRFDDEARGHGGPAAELDGKRARIGQR